MNKTIDETRRKSRIARQLANAARAVAIRLEAPVSARSVSNAKEKVGSARRRAQIRAAQLVADVAENPLASDWD